jgi:hypothetical protein
MRSLLRRLFYPFLLLGQPVTVRAQEGKPSIKPMVKSGDQSAAIDRAKRE